MSPEETLAALGLDGAEQVTYEEFAKLPGHRRYALHGPGAKSLLLRLPDPAPVAALRRIHAEAVGHVSDGCADDCSLPAFVRDTAAEALAEFDGTSS